MEPCETCVYYKTPSCIGEYSRALLIEDYDFDCFTTEEYKLLCDIMCGDIEEEY